MAIRAALLGILAGELILGSAGTFAQRASARQEISELQDSLQDQVELLRDLDELKVHLDSLRKKSDILSDVAGGVPVHGVLAELSRVTPDSMVLTHLHLTQRRHIRDLAASDSPGRPEDDEGGILEITGRADSDIVVGVLMTSLADSVLFEDVKLTYSQPTEVEGRGVREFKITCSFPQFE